MTASPQNAQTALVASLNQLLGDSLVLFMKTKNFHWHVAGPNFRDLHLLFDEQAAQIFAQIDPIAERVRKLGGHTLGSLADAISHASLSEQRKTDLAASEMIAELEADNRALVEKLKQAKQLASEVGDNATEGLIDDWTDQAEERVWFLHQTRQPA